SCGGGTGGSGGGRRGGGGVRRGCVPPPGVWAHGEGAAIPVLRGGVLSEFSYFFLSRRNVPLTLAITRVNSTRSTGLATWKRNPALSVRNLSLFPVSDVSATAGIRFDAATPSATSSARTRRSAA